MNLTDEELEAIADRVADKLQERFYMEVGKKVFHRFVWIMGVIVVASVLYMKDWGWLK